MRYLFFTIIALFYTSFSNSEEGLLFNRFSMDEVRVHGKGPEPVSVQEGILKLSAGTILDGKEPVTVFFPFPKSTVTEDKPLLFEVMAKITGDGLSAGGLRIGFWNDEVENAQKYQYKGLYLSLSVNMRMKAELSFIYPKEELISILNSPTPLLLKGNPSGTLLSNGEDYVKIVITLYRKNDYYLKATVGSETVFDHKIEMNGQWNSYIGENGEEFFKFNQLSLTAYPGSENPISIEFKEPSLTSK